MSYNSSNGAVSVSWQFSPGPVTGYTLEKYDWYSGLTTNFNFPAGTNQCTDTVPPIPYIPPWLNGPTVQASYWLQAHYAVGDSDWSEEVLLEPESAPDAGVFGGSPVFMIAGPDGSASLAASALPPGTAALRLTRIDAYAEFLGDFSFDTNFDISVTAFTNGFYHLPLSWTTVGPDAYGYAQYNWWVQTFDENNSPGASLGLRYGSAYNYNYNMRNTSFAVPPFFDGRAQLKQDLIFLLRAGTESDSFHFIEYTNSGIVISTKTFTNPVNYAYASYYSVYDYAGTYPAADLQVFTPFAENTRYRNFVFGAADLNADGHLTTGVSGGYDFNDPFPPGLLLQDLPTYFFQPPSTNGATIPALLATNQTRWLCSYPLDSSFSYLEDIGIVWDGTNTFHMAGADRNIFGLPFLSAEVAYGLGGVLHTDTLYAGGSTSPGSYFYPETEQPQFQNVEYHFWQPNVDWLPGHGPFSPTNANHLLIASMGTPFAVAAYAKLALQNGFTNKFGYLGQYFEKAYKIDTNGVVTTNETGVLSPYGEFFPTEPGPAALVTMPDIDTGQRGTGVVQVIKLQLDVNHDGEMDLSFAGPDNTSASHPYVFWVNDDNDGEGVGEDVKVTRFYGPNYRYGLIRSWRNLEDFARLWICGLPKLPEASGYSATFSMSPLSGNPSVNLYAVFDTNSGPAYLSDTNAAKAQFTQITLGNQVFFDFAKSLASISSNQSYTLPVFPDGHAYYTNFLFEGAGIGKGELKLTISQGTNVLAQTSAWLDLHDIKDFYERAVITNDTSGYKSNWNSAVETVVSRQHPDSDADQNLIVLVHGINVRPWDCIVNGETVLKRLYWAGFHGKFATVKWPCNLLTPIPDPLSPANFNESELQAYKSWDAMEAYWAEVSDRFPNYRVHLLVHSQGNAMVSEMIRIGGLPFDTYIMTQCALPDSAYDVDAPANTNLTSLETGADITPDWHPWGYHGIYTNLTFIDRRIVNFYNPLDKVLGYWIENHKKLKPSKYFSTAYYSYNGTNSHFHPFVGDGYLVTDPHESRAMVARSRTDPIGMSGPESEHGVIKSAVNLNTHFGFNGATVDEHSAQWTRPIQTSRAYYLQVLESIKP